MKPKPFTLGRLLDLRLLRQKRSQQALAAASDRVRRQEEELDRAVHRQVTVRNEMRAVLEAKAGQGRTVDVAAARRYRTHLAALALSAGQAAAKLPALRESESAARLELVETRRAARVIENLRDRRRQALRLWERRREQKILDDLANRSAQRSALSKQPPGRTLAITGERSALIADR